ncbi:MAG: ABC transporter permease [Defluviitaleaceae bacterium]|nr:ABC transporter permease [Defluviitaleaceae bacterium]
MFALSVAVFALSRLAPGDPLYAYYGDALDRMAPHQIEAAARRLQLGGSAAGQYFAWLGSALRGDFGISFIYKRPVGEVISNLWLNTLLLGGTAYVLTFALSVLLAVFCARREGSLADAAVCKAGTVSSAIPTFFVALMCILVFAVNLKILPTGGAYEIGKSGDAASRVKHLVLPVFTLAFSHVWYYAYILRNKLIDELRKDYVLFLKIKRLSVTRILYRHCLRNCLPALVTIMAVSVPHIISGAYAAELVFGYPGLGTLAFMSARHKDYNSLLTVTMLTGFFVMAAGIAGQEISAALDPAMRHEKKIKAENFLRAAFMREAKGKK